MTELSPPEFGAVRRLFGTDFPFPEALSVVERTNPGWIFVDDSATPETALVWSRGIEGFYLVGRKDNVAFLGPLDAYVARIIAPRASNLGLEWFEVNGEDDAWGDVIESTFRTREIGRSTQCVFRLPEAESRSMVRVDPIVRRVDEHLLSEASLGNREFLTSKIETYWDSLDAFLKKGVGFAAIADDRVVSLCFSAFVAGDAHAVDVETMPDARRHHFAQRAGAAFAAECRARELTLHWDCMSDNDASIGLAGKLGLRKIREYALYNFPLAG